MTRAASGRRGAAGRKPEHRQINCRISPGVAAALDECRGALEARLAETVRAAVLVLLRHVEANREGARVLVRYPDGRTVELLIPVIVGLASERAGAGARS